MEWWQSGCSVNLRNPSATFFTAPIATPSFGDGDMTAGRSRTGNSFQGGEGNSQKQTFVSRNEKTKKDLTKNENIWAVFQTWRSTSMLGDRGTIGNFVKISTRDCLEFQKTSLLMAHSQTTSHINFHDMEIVYSKKIHNQPVNFDKNGKGLKQSLKTRHSRKISYALGTGLKYLFDRARLQFHAGTSIQNLN